MYLPKKELNYYLHNGGKCKKAHKLFEEKYRLAGIKFRHLSEMLFSFIGNYYPEELSLYSNLKFI